MAHWGLDEKKSNFKNKFDKTKRCGILVKLKSVR